jgi:hypothetical protein
MELWVCVLQPAPEGSGGGDGVGIVGHTSLVGYKGLVSYKGFLLLFIFHTYYFYYN